MATKPPAFFALQNESFDIPDWTGDSKVAHPDIMIIDIKIINNFFIIQD